MDLFTIETLSKKVPYSIHTLYKKKKKMTEGVHYFQDGTGKILFCDEAVSFFLNKSKGKHESVKGNSFQTKGNTLSLSQFVG